MEVFGLVAKLTLDSDEYSRALREAESEGSHIDDPASPSLDLDKSPFDDKVLEAENEHVDDPDAPELDLDNEPFKEKLDEATTESETFSSSIGQIWDGIKDMMVAAGVVAVVTGLISSLTEAVDLARSVGDNIDKSSRAMSISTDAYQEWSHVLDINGASITDLNRGLMNMRKIMGGGEVTDEIRDAFGALKINPSEYKSTEDLLTDTMRKLADFDTLTDEGRTQRDYLTQTLFGRSGTKLNAMLDGTSQDIDDLIQQAHDLGLVMSEESVANAAAYNDAVTNLNASFEAFRISLVEGILPTLTTVANEAAKIFAMFNLRSDQQSLSEIFEGIDKDGANALVTIKQNKAEAESLIDKIAKMGDYWTLDDSGKKTFDALASELITLFPQLDSVISTNKNAIMENTKAITANIDEWTRLEQQRVLDQNLVAKREEVAKKYAQALEKETEAEVKDSEAYGQRMALIDEMNSLIEKGTGRGTAGGTFAYYGIDKVTSENYEEAARVALNHLNEYTYKDLQNRIREASGTAGQAEELRKQAKALTEEADEAMESYTKFAEALASKMGLTIQSTEDASSAVDTLNSKIKSLPKQKQVQIDAIVSWNTGIDFPPKAKGDWNVPYDMPVLAHRGATILNASQARRYREGQGNGLDYAQVASIVGHEVRKAMERISVNMSGEKVGDLTTKRVKNNINASSYSKLRAKGG